ncbi:MAG: hypothetical protein A4E19_15310 [Nitrospira sp. SG-bin1]|nr:MAG: hypothetical protein A4E19_15310 [Nitrospira sp. SG-bin1]
MKLVLIEWVDSHSGRGWQDIEAFEQAAVPLYCRSVGWLVSDKKDCKVLVPHISGEKNGKTLLQGCGDLAIPTAAIEKITVLRR